MALDLFMLQEALCRFAARRVASYSVVLTNICTGGATKVFRIPIYLKVSKTFGEQLLFFLCRST